MFIIFGIIFIVIFVIAITIIFKGMRLQKEMRDQFKEVMGNSQINNGNPNTANDPHMQMHMDAVRAHQQMNNDAVFMHQMAQDTAMHMHNDAMDMHNDAMNMNNNIPTPPTF